MHIWSSDFSECPAGTLSETHPVGTIVNVDVFLAHHSFSYFSVAVMKHHEQGNL